MTEIKLNTKIAGKSMKFIEPLKQTQLPKADNNTAKSVEITAYYGFPGNSAAAKYPAAIKMNERVAVYQQYNAIHFWESGMSL